MAGDIRIGISGWRYPPWRGTFYPKGLKQDHELAYASRQLNSIEINGSFYSLQSPASYRKWRDAVPPDFLFALKCSRYVTHIKRLNDIRQPLANFFASGLLTLGRKLGPLLWQFPPQMKYDRERFERFFALLPRTFAQAQQLAETHDSWMSGMSRRADYTTHDADSSSRLRHAVEIRNETFRDANFIELLRDHDISLVIADTAGKWPMIEELTSDFLYLRLHGEEQIYVSGYDEASLERWAERIRIWKSGRQAPDAHRVTPDAKAPRKSRDVFVYFDNDVKVRAPFDAMNLLEKTTDFRPEHVQTYPEEAQSYPIPRPLTVPASQDSRWSFARYKSRVEREKASRRSSVPRRKKAA